MNHGFKYWKLKSIFFVQNSSFNFFNLSNVRILTKILSNNNTIIICVYEWIFQESGGKSSNLTTLGFLVSLEVFSIVALSLSVKMTVSLSFRNSSSVNPANEDGDLGLFGDLDKLKWEF